MVRPHGNDLVDRIVGQYRSRDLWEDIDDSSTVTLNKNLLFDFVNIAQGVYSPLRGFMTQNDFLKVVNDLTLESGLVWPLPVVLDIDAELANNIEPGDRIGIRRPDGTPLGVMDTDSIYRYDEANTCENLFGTTDGEHPGVRTIQNKDPFFVGGPIKAFSEAIPRNGNHDITPKEARVLFNKRGFDTVVGFQTRNVPHRAHEYLQKSALEHIDGLLIQPKIGEKKAGDYTNNAIIQGYESLIDNYYPTQSVVLSIFKSRMMYAGPREALFDSIVRKNYGCTHFIVGRDHAGVGNYYGDFAAQELFSALGNIGIEPLYYHYAFYCTKCDGIVSEKICPHDNDHHMNPSGTKLRGMLSEGERPPSQLMRPEVTETVLNLEKIFVQK
ncbi:sulfate adenylyltransferase [Halorubrum sp. Atlit-8R]|uniref:sulfate adenylyltransferase n=1 Tax=unclassified Halorubrum TaxID=2642239 RepID=UPI000EF2531C|nr:MULTISPECIES: sulfate adenylyltransferase [unclassified Halorubrum]RLM70768.1 sulfate adenylyltransferase [Halorubrum sp. Atlit-9R]RLM71636.1 sulfate adenylyltransferase [Halorubrum sp. Atlit-9R]RLM83079.1 sulfate adenylyltransferase [Halorubrum sp. Atlit-8R]